ncbi:MAG TPA: hypothetical protein VE690_10995 [Rhodopila sp.]|nr:hypothetical protein [Rhodopila sp.]
MKLFLDLDGVLADFDAGVQAVTGRRPEEPPIKTMWAALARAPAFFETLRFMTDAEVLWAFCKPHHPTILTGLPRGTWAPEQKKRWVANMLGAHVPIITCMTHEKPRWSGPGHVLVDDRPDDPAGLGEEGRHLRSPRLRRTLDRRPAPPRLQRPSGRATLHAAPSLTDRGCGAQPEPVSQPKESGRSVSGRSEAVAATAHRLLAARGSSVPGRSAAAPLPAEHPGRGREVRAAEAAGARSPCCPSCYFSST